MNLLPDTITHTDIEDLIERLMSIAKKQDPDKDDFSFIKEIAGDFALADWKKVIDELLLQLKQIESYTLVVPIKLKQQTLKNLHAALQQSIARPFVFEVVVDPGILGGCTIEINGRFYDKRLSKRLDHFVID